MINFPIIAHFANVKNNLRPLKTTNNLHPHACDTVSFCGKKEDEPVPKKVIKFYNKIKSENANGQVKNEDIKKNIEQEVPQKVLIEDVSNVLQNFEYDPNLIAHMTPLYDDDLNFYAAIILTRPELQKKSLPYYLSSISHEYGHILQRNDDDSYLGIKNYTSDKNEAEIIGKYALKTHDILRLIYFRKLYENPEFTSKMKSGQINYSFIKSAIVGNKDISDLNRATIGFIYKELCKNDDLQNLKNNPKLDDKTIKNAIRDSVSKMAEMEAEVYGAEYEILSAEGLQEFANEKQLMQVLNEVMSR